jgi:L-serine dehydratase
MNLLLIRHWVSHSRRTVCTDYEPESKKQSRTMNPPKSAREEGAFPELPAEPNLSANIDRRAFLIRNAVIGAAAVMTGAEWTPDARAQQAAKETAAPKLGSTMSPDLEIVKESKGPVMTVVEEFYKVGPGPSSSHTIGPMRITYNFYQRCTKLPADQLAQATGLKVHLYGSLSATGKGHGTERASLAGLVGKEPATVDPLFLDEMAAKPDQSYPVKLDDKTFNLSLADIIYDSPKGDFPHPNTMTCKLLAGDKVLLEQEYYSPGGGFIEWKGYTPRKKGQPKYPYATMKELRKHAEDNNLSIAQVIMANELAVSGKSEEEINAFLDKIAGAMLATVKSGLSVRKACCPALSSCTRKRPPSGSGPRTTNTKASAPSRWFPPSPWPLPRRTRAAPWSSPHRRAVQPA